MESRKLTLSQLLDLDEIHQAAGMIAAQLGITCHDAYTVFDRNADELRWPRYALALEVTAGGLRLGHPGNDAVPLGW